MAWAYAKLYKNQPHLYDCTVGATIARKDEFTSQGVSNVLYVFRFLEYSDASCITLLAALIVASLMNEYNSLYLANIS